MGDMSTGRAGTKSRSGCITCKVRKVKCDEERPICRRCSSTQRGCQYDGRQPSSLASSSPFALAPGHSLSLLPGTGQRERRAFQYYFHHAAQHLAGGVNMDFWTAVVPQICRTEPAIWDGMIAISALFEYPDQCLDFTLLRNANAQKQVLNQAQQEALAWYSRSISSIHSQIERGKADPYVALVSCVLFICIETLQGRMEEALQLFQQGVTLILDLRIQAGLGRVPAWNTASLEKTIIPLFLRLGTMSLAISGVQASGIFALADNHLDPVLTSVDSARSVITVLSAEAILFDREASEHLKAVGGDSAISPEMLERQKVLLARLDHWYHTYMNLSKLHEPRSVSPTKAESVLLAYFAASYIHVSGCLTQLETIYDCHHEKFVTIVDQASMNLGDLAGPKGAQPPFTFDMSIGLPLFLVALKCREPTLRRKALNLLRQAPPMQGFFKCTPVSLLAENLMILEENYALALQGFTDQTNPRSPLGGQFDKSASSPDLIVTSIPEEARICFYGVFRPSNGLPPSINKEDFARYNRGPDQLFLEIARNRYDGISGTWYPVHEVLPLGG